MVKEHLNDLRGKNKGQHIQMSKITKLPIIFTQCRDLQGLHRVIFSIYKTHLLHAGPSKVVVGSQVWVEDPEVAWIDGDVLEINGQQIRISCTSEKEVHVLSFHFVGTKLCNKGVNFFEEKLAPLILLYLFFFRIGKAMKLGSPKSMPAYPKTLLSIAASVGGLALFLIFASLILVYQPIGFKVSGYFYNLNQTSVTGLWSSNNETGIFGLEVNGTSIFGLPVNGTSISGLPVNSTGIFGLEVNGTSIFGLPVNGTSISGLPVNSTSISGLQVNGTRKKRKIVDSGCDLYNGTWVHDSAGPLYSNNSCPVLSQMQNCQGNGRPDKDYENWRWKPTQCDLPRFDPKNFLEMLRGKTLAFIGDSVARNQMESLLCILWQAEVPKNRGNKKMQRYYFRSTSTMIVRIWSSWLIHKTTEKFDFAPEGVDKLHLDAPDQTLIDVIPSFDVLVLSSGHWFAKQSVYILNNEIVGGQLWWPDNSKEKKIDSTEAFEISVNTFISSLVTHPNYTGLTVVRSYSPDHYEGGSWNTGGSCTGKVKPAVDGELVESGFTNMMHDKQVLGFNRGVKKKTNKSRVSFMDITKPFAYRHDGHPGPYRSPDPNKITKRSADGRPPPQDCLHWCMPGPVDMWNEFLMEIIRRDFETEDS